MLNLLKSIGKEKLTEKFTAAVVYGLLSSFAMNFFFIPGHVYSTGIGGLSQIVSTLVINATGHDFLPVSLGIYLFNLPLLVLAWFQLGKRFTIYTIFTVTMSSVMIHFIPRVTLTHDPIINALAGAVLMGLGVGYVFRNNISSGGTDIISLTIRRHTGRTVGVVGTAFNAVIVTLAGALFGWPNMFYSLIVVFIAGRVTDAVFDKQKKMQVTIITENPDDIKDAISEKLHRGVTMIRGAEGGFTHARKTIVMTAITNFEYHEFRDIIKKNDPHAFVTIAQNVRILGKFDEDHP
ncbi:MAG: YitT family protein [Streptococcaceae bacterium]|jgi:uncharacterized membrane-anchored protein YitT (DUF2179 family)|nr:YitT family protein [Streptococcaceae bacterium]